MADQAVIGGAGGSLLPAVARRSEAVVIPLVALVAGFAIFAVFLMTQGKSPAEFLSYVWKGAYGSAFIENRGDAVLVLLDDEEAEASLGKARGRR